MSFVNRIIDFNEILDNLFIGECPKSPEAVAHLRDSAGITAILNLQSADDIKTVGIDFNSLWKRIIMMKVAYRRVEILDLNPEDLLKKLDEAVAVLDELISGGHKVYLHCTYGINRSPTVAAAYLIKIRGMDASSAGNFIRERRSSILYDDVLLKMERRLKDPTEK
ncbi:MAG: dual specificity protein phosphatase family protein [Deltaproteobacteria bacterium]|nr:dual specificity protein phosphatase family protein [Deltaproteobacteria bacterium]